MSEPFKKQSKALQRGKNGELTECCCFCLLIDTIHIQRPEQSTKSLFITYLNCLLSKQYYITVGLKDTQGKKKFQQFGLVILLEGQKWHQKTIKSDSDE